MNIELILQLVKEELGIKSGIRDNYITAIIKGITKELEDEKGLILEYENFYHLLFIVDYVAWSYRNKDHAAMPRHLQYRLHNLIIHVGRG
ncbi:hypothetical protein ACUH7Y_25240 [Clostridium beijerinckii]|uniref:Phage gp6-like head-tail connector protein n=2 Tax=Clostridium beijerinckii TaxID=1520 RepID=A0AB74VFR2_CLOBE|nr:hypothetical protein [Clostridium beijerinckii]NMF06535.1 hypothetical protein [Clostridium beijerinckii]NOW08055.1 hypothetical protein [Clostridium beijerinckii]NRZ24351.1 hypothetical protein [Clostridium beijerinckii]NYB99430.1 hypothetical protein [Clostridium beijerinckii]NYC05669.1 hypothetical protein [Clostridium beijerinckii]